MRVLVGLTGASGVDLGVRFAAAAQACGCDVGVIYTPNAVRSWWLECGRFERGEGGGANSNLSHNLDANSLILNQNRAGDGAEFAAAQADLAQADLAKTNLIKTDLAKTAQKTENFPRAEAEFRATFAPRTRFFTRIDDEPASGSSRWEALVVVPCSANSLAKIAAGVADSLLLRAAAVMLKERRRLVLAVREMPFSTLALEQMARLSQMGAIIAPPVYAGYSRARSVGDLQAFFAGKLLDVLGVENELFARWQGGEI